MYDHQSGFCDLLQSFRSLIFTDHAITFHRCQYSSQVYLDTGDRILAGVLMLRGFNPLKRLKMSFEIMLVCLSKAKFVSQHRTQTIFEVPLMPTADVKFLF